MGIFVVARSRPPGLRKSGEPLFLVRGYAAASAEGYALKRARPDAQERIPTEPDARNQSSAARSRSCANFCKKSNSL